MVDPGHHLSCVHHYRVYTFPGEVLGRTRGMCPTEREIRPRHDTVYVSE